MVRGQSHFLIIQHVCLNHHQQIISASDEIKEFDIAIKELFDKLDKAEIFEKVKHRGNIANYTLKYQFEVITKLKREKIIEQYFH